MHRLNEINRNSPKRTDNGYKPGPFADIDRIQALLKHYNGGTLLDMGCRDNPVLAEVKAAYPDSRIVGIDFAPQMIAHLQKEYPDVEYICEDVRKVDIEADYIIAGELIEHLDDPAAFIKHCLSLLRPGGWLAISTPLNEGDKFWLDREEHIWSFSLEDIVSFLPGGTYNQYDSRIIMAWKQV